MCDHQIPAVVQVLQHVILNVVRGLIFSRQQIAGPSVMSTRGEGPPDHARELTGD
jgi:hypothetical protein